MIAPGSEVVPVTIWWCSRCRRGIDFTRGIGPRARHMGRRMDRHIADQHGGMAPMGTLVEWTVIRSPHREEVGDGDVAEG